MSVMASQITSLTIVYSTVYSGADHRKHQSSLSLAFVRGIHQWLVNSPHKGPVTLKMCPFDDVIMTPWIDTCSASIHNLNQCWLIMNWTLSQKFCWSLKPRIWHHFPWLNIMFYTIPVAGDARLSRGITRRYSYAFTPRNPRTTNIWKRQPRLSESHRHADQIDVLCPWRIFDTQGRCN